MRSAVLLAAAPVITFSSILLWAQQSGGRPQQNVTAATPAASIVWGELKGKLDAKTARVGEAVVLTTTEKVTTTDGTVIPKGTRSIGHVTEALAHDSADADSELGIAFDRAELKNGRSVLIHSTIETVSPPQTMMASTLMNVDDSLGGVSAAGGLPAGRQTGDERVTGGGLVSNSVERVDVTQGSLSEHMDSSASGDVYTTEALAHVTGHAAGDAEKNEADMHGAGRADAAAAGRLRGSNPDREVMRSTGIEGVMLRTGNSGTASGTFSSSKRNVLLDSGTQMDLSFAAVGR